MFFMFEVFTNIKNKFMDKFFPAAPTPAHLRAWPFPEMVEPEKKKRGRPRKNPAAKKTVKKKVK